eukprot:Seg562.16 transcript_id=Seg562.16/GoldUCD/mRNA.D3Y31 product="hypothetical protein" protein_id=Seg562.16/GoldUCD/D3Y31
MVTGTAFYAGYLTPILVIVVANLIVMGFVIRSLKKSAQVSKDRKMTGLTMARIIAACSVLMGTTWVIGTLPREKSSATLTSFAAQPSTKKGYFPESETNGLQTSSENMDMSFQLQPGEAAKGNGTKVAQPSSSTVTNRSHVNRGLKESGSDSMEMIFGIEPVASRN